MFHHNKKQVLRVAFVLAGVAILVGCQKQADEKSPSAPVTAKPNSDAHRSSDAAADPAAGADRIVPQQTCTVDKADFAKWFQGGTVTKDGLVTPADSLQSLDTLCGFYQWSWRMFLWQTSRSSGGLVFNSPPFFNLNDQNELVSQKPGASTRMALRGGKFEQTGRTGQAGIVSGVLMAQPPGVNADGSLVYYAIHVNDVFAYMASGVNSKGLTDVTQFPTTADQRDVIVQYAKQAYGVNITDANSLAMEMKSAWIQVNDSMDHKNFITMKSDIPKYVQVGDQKWTWDGTTLERGVTLACVGYHLVGSTADHPEMIWATFEHSKNVPDANYYYVAKDGTVTLQKNWTDDGYPILKNWLFMDGKSKQQSMNQMHMELKGHDIVATPNKTIGPSNTMRTHPWGGTPDEQSASNNTAILSINDNIASMLADGDVRKNYFLIGATWTANGVPGVGLQIPEVAGSLTLSNSTMETYLQYKNCFGCHQGGKLNGLSHIFGGIKPLPVPAQ